MAQVWLHHCHQHHHYHWHHHHLHRHHHCEQGVLGKLGNPSTVLGVDISDEMISHCSNHYNGQENLSFQVVFFYIRFGSPYWMEWLLNLIQFLARPWTCQVDQSSARQMSLPSTWQVNPGQSNHLPFPINSPGIKHFQAVLKSYQLKTFPSQFQVGWPSVKKKLPATYLSQAGDLILLPALGAKPTWSCLVGFLAPNGGRRLSSPALATCELVSLVT